MSYFHWGLALTESTPKAGVVEAVHALRVRECQAVGHHTSGGEATGEKVPATVTFLLSPLFLSCHVLEPYKLTVQAHTQVLHMLENDSSLYVCFMMWTQYLPHQ